MTDIDMSAYKGRIVPVNWGERDVGNWVARSFTYNDFASSGNTIDLIDLPANSFVAELYFVVKTIFNGTPVILIGDEDGATYMGANDITEGSGAAALVADMMAVDVGAAYTLKGARPFYADANNHIQVTFSWSQTPTAGEACVIACIVEVPSY